MGNFLRKTGWISIVSSIIFAIIGIVLIYNPETALKVIIYILGSIFIILGLVKIINYFAQRGSDDFYNYELVYGIIAIVIGIVAMIYSGTIGTVFRIIIGLWIIYSGLIRFNLSLKLRKADVKIWSFVFSIAVLILLCGIYIVLSKGAIMVTIGAIILLYSIMDLVESIIFMRNVNRLSK